MGVVMQVSQAGAKLTRIQPSDAKPGLLYGTLLTNNVQGPFVTCRINKDGETQIGPLPDSIRLADVVALVQLPRIERIKVDGGPEIESPTSDQVIDMIAKYGAQHQVSLHLAS